MGVKLIHRDGDLRQSQGLDSGNIDGACREGGVGDLTELSGVSFEFNDPDRKVLHGNGSSGFCWECC